MERDIPAAQLLRKHRKDIDIIHSRVALLLQMLSEKSGGTDARLSSEDFKAIVDSRLSEEEFTGKERGDLRDQIIEAAANRLVFLVGLQAGQVGFEIRSFQEFLASEGLMQGSDNDVQGRLREIAPIISWRNVFLFAAGRCFAEAQHLRDTIHTICVEMNEELAGPAGRLTLLGSRLSIDLLDDGVTHQQPKYAKLLARCAFQILDLPPSKSHEQLATTFYYGLKEIFKEEILNRICKSNFKETLGSWAILLELINNGVDWAEEIGNEFWPLEHVKQREIFSPMPPFRYSGWYRIKYEKWIADGNSEDVWDFLTLIPRGKNLGNEIKSQNLREFVKLYSLNLHGNTEARFDIKLPDQGKTTIPLKMSLLSRDIENFNFDISSLNVFQQGWVPFIEGLKFWLSPSKEKLSIAMHNIAAHSPDNGSEEVWHLPAAMNLPWVYISCLKAARDPASFHELADKIASGSFGDYPDWLKAEKRWKEFGVTIEDLLEVQSAIPFGENIAKKGFPLGGYIFSSWRQFRIASNIPILYKLYTLLESNSILRTELAADLFRYGIFHPMARDEFSQSFFTWNQIKEILKDYGQKINFPLELIILIQEQCKSTNESWIDFVEQLGNSIKFIGYISPIHHDKWLEIWEELGNAFNANRSRKGLIPIIQKCLMNGIYEPFIGININSADFIEPDNSLAAVMIQLIQRELPQDAAEELAKTTGELIPSVPDAVRKIVAMIETGEIFNEGIERFLLELNKHLKIDDIESKNNLNNCLQELLRRRKTKLAEPNTWKNHRLPEGVITLL
ncbi:MAG: hypothetical protein R3B95_17475 [Nitrospirales bacterium]|nr:hypothetical protein [Nitrospirales bacterium]